jgi:filamentous hemagglutinin
VQQLEDQMAQMNLVTTDGQALPGDVRVATGEKPQDSTVWMRYGVNREGQVVWTLSVRSKCVSRLAQQVVGKSRRNE